MEVSVKLVKVFFGIATGFWSTFVPGGGVVWRSREYMYLLATLDVCGSFVLQPQCVACSVAGVIS